MEFNEYMAKEGSKRGAARLANSQQFTMELLAAKSKAMNAPVVSGGSGTSGTGNSGGSYSGNRNLSYNGPMNFGKLPGGRVLPTGSRISQEWGKSRIRYAAGRHTGMDFGGAHGSAIKSAASGVVVRTGWEGAYGNRIAVKHKDGTTGFYAHLSGINVKPGQRVKAGQKIGKMGSTGRSTGTHLHFEIRKQDRYGGDINPRSWLSTR